MVGHKNKNNGYNYRDFVIAFTKFMYEHGREGLTEKQIEHRFLIPYNASLGFKHEKGQEEWRRSWKRHERRIGGFFKKVGKRKRHK